ncbi:MAG: hypothetical protein U0105_20095 [Candidatus Obscuribacterales bacterium]
MRVSAIICALAASFLLLVQWSCAETSAARHAGKHHGQIRVVRIGRGTPTAAAVWRAGGRWTM